MAGDTNYPGLPLITNLPNTELAHVPTLPPEEPDNMLQANNVLRQYTLGEVLKDADTACSHS